MNLYEYLIVFNFFKSFYLQIKYIISNNFNYNIDIFLQKDCFHSLVIDFYFLKGELYRFTQKYLL